MESKDYFVKCPHPLCDGTMRIPAELVKTEFQCTCICKATQLVVKWEGQGIDLHPVVALESQP